MEKQGDGKNQAPHARAAEGLTPGSFGRSPNPPENYHSPPGENCYPSTFHDCRELPCTGGGGDGKPDTDPTATLAATGVRSILRTPTRFYQARGRSPSSTSSRGRGAGGSDGSSRWESAMSAGSARRLSRESGGGGGGGSRISVGSRVSFGSGASDSSSASSVLAGSAHIALKAAAEGDKAAVMAFLDSGGDVNAKSKTGASTLLSRAAAKGRLAVVNLLLERGAAVNIPGRGGLTPLHEAAGCEKLEVCEVLLGAGAAVAARDYSNRCPLHYAGGSLSVTKLLLDFGADPEAQDNNRQRPDVMAVNHEARALLRDARCAVKECGVGDNASRVIASLRRELSNLEAEADGARIKAAQEASRRAEVQAEVDMLRTHVSTLSEDVERLRKEASATQQTLDGAEPSLQTVAVQAELRQVRAALKVARASALEEQQRRQSLEDKFDAGVAEVMDKARADRVYTAASSSIAGTPRLLRRPAASPMYTFDQGAGAICSDVAAATVTSDRVGEENITGAPREKQTEAARSVGGGGLSGNGVAAAVMVSDDGRGDVCSPGGDVDHDEHARGQPGPDLGEGQRRDLGAGLRAGEKDGEKEEEGVEKQQRLEELVAAADAALEKTRAAASAKEEGNRGRGFVEQRIVELEQQEAAALAAAMAAAATLPSLQLPPRRRYTAGVLSPRLGSPSYLASKGFSSFGGVSTAAAAGGGRQTRDAGECRSLESALDAAAAAATTGTADEREQPRDPSGDTLPIIPARAPSSTVGAPIDVESKPPTYAKTPDSTPTVAPRVSVESAAAQSVTSAADGAAAAAADIKAASTAANDGSTLVVEDSQAENTAAGAAAEEAAAAAAGAGVETRGESGGAACDPVYRATTAEALAVELQAELEEMKAQLSAIRFENKLLREKAKTEKSEKLEEENNQKMDNDKENVAGRRGRGTETTRNGEGDECYQGGQSYFKPGSAARHDPEQGQGMLMRFLQGIRPVSHLYWDD